MDDVTERNARAAQWAAGAGATFIGRPADDARAAARAAGLTVKTVPASGVTTLEFGIGRVRITVGDDDLVTGIAPG